MESRLEQYYNIWNSLPEKENVCLTEGGLLKYIKFNTWIGSGTFGDVYGGLLRTKDKNSPLSNVTTLKKSRAKNAKYDIIIKTAYASKAHKDEANLLEKVSDLAFYHRCPHFPLYYGYYLCNSIKFKGARGRGVYKAPGHWEIVRRGKGLIQIQEFGGISFEKWLQTRPNAYELYAAIAQVLISVYALRKYVKINHMDLYFNNIVMYKVNKPIVFKYRINGYEYNIKNVNYYPIIIDFGQADSIKNYQGSPDLFQFLTDFCVSEDGTRPKLRNGKISFTYNIPYSVKQTISNMLNDMLYYIDDIDTNLPYKEWMRTKYVTSDILLKKYFLNYFSNSYSRMKSHIFKI